MKTLLLILLLPAMGFSQNDTTINVKNQYKYYKLKYVGDPNGTGTIVFRSNETTDTAYVNIALIGSAGSLHIVPGMIITKIDKYGFTEETRYFIQRTYSGKLREIDESQVWEYKPIKRNNLD